MPRSLDQRWPLPRFDGVQLDAELAVVVVPVGRVVHAPVRVCNATRCAAIVNPKAIPQLRTFYYSGPPLARIRRPVLGAPYNELRFRTGYVTGIIATRRLDRFLSYGVHLDRFARGTWYAVPRQLSHELRQRAANLCPLHVTRAALEKSR